MLVILVVGGNNEDFIFGLASLEGRVKLLFETVDIFFLNAVISVDNVLVRGRVTGNSTEIGGNVERAASHVGGGLERADNRDVVVGARALDCGEVSLGSNLGRDDVVEHDVAVRQ